MTAALLWLGVALSGGVGVVLRFLVDGRVSERTGRAFPYGTLVVNLSGAVLLGLITGLALNPQAALVVGTGAVGAYTTFSTWMFETQRLGEDRQLTRLAANLAVSLVAGLAAAAAGEALGGVL
ncbi:MAG: fluoride efflux transporter CrcB [Actinomycetota bacterium]|nr:fluoride efflux transporter CrcB [Actinomycetota bacterium]